MSTTTLSLALASALAVGGLTVIAQTPAPAPQGQPPAAGPAPAAGPQDAGRGGRGAEGAGRAGGVPGAGGPRGGGRGPTGGPSLGGGNMDDPAYVGVDFSPRPPVLPLTPAEQIKKTWMQPGFKLEAILTEPAIKEPAQIAFDGNGRMFVAELRTYMQDIDSSTETQPLSRISIHEDRNNDGIYETSGVFVDNIVAPRFVMPFGANAVLTMETNADEVWKFTDTDNNGQADRKELFATGFGRLQNIELQQSGLTWAMDNWLYSTVNQFRARWTPTGVLREPTGNNGAQWGVTQDNYGKVYFQGGGSGLPTYFQLPIAYGTFNHPTQLLPDIRIMWGAPVGVADGVVGMNDVRLPDGSMVSTTAGAGNDIFRGHRLPADMVGDYFYGEVVGRIVRRMRPYKTDGITQLRNVYDYSEFIRSLDPLFRPVDMTTAPDGTMYITDMYRGVIQHRQWNSPTQYIRARVNQYQLDKVISHGRIFRLTHESMTRDTRQPRMLNETPAQLVAHLSHANGWWRDTAQQLLVIKQDKSVVPALTRLARTGTNQLGRIHALWTLEGLGSADAALVRALMKDTDPQVRAQAIRVSETLYKGGDRSFAADYKSMSADANADVAIQALLTLNTLRVPDAAATVKIANDTSKSEGVKFVAGVILNPAAGGRGVGRGGEAPPTASPAEVAALAAGGTVFAELCSTCHGADGRGEATPSGDLRAPSLAGSSRVNGHRDYIIKVLLNGLQGPIDGETYVDQIMVPMGQNNDEWIANVASYVRNSFGNNGSYVTPADVARARASVANRTTPWTTAELLPTIPRQLVVEEGWRVTASHNSATARNALGFAPWTTGEPQQAGMWLQVELPREVTLTEIQFQAAAPTGGGGRGGGGRGGAAAGGAAGGPAPAAPPAPPSAGFPRGYQVQVSTDGANWTTVAQGQGAPGTMTAAFNPTRAKFARITQTATPTESVPAWNVILLRLFDVAQARP